MSKSEIESETELIAPVQVYRVCSEIDTSGLKDPRLHEQTMISALYNLGRLLDDDGRHQVTLITYMPSVYYELGVCGWFLVHVCEKLWFFGSVSVLQN